MPTVQKSLSKPLSLFLVCLILLLRRIAMLCTLVNIWILPAAESQRCYLCSWINGVHCWSALSPLVTSEKMGRRENHLIDRDRRDPDPQDKLQERNFTTKSIEWEAVSDYCGTSQTISGWPRFCSVGLRFGLRRLSDPSFSSWTVPLRKGRVIRISVDKPPFPR